MKDFEKGLLILALGFAMGCASIEKGFNLTFFGATAECDAPKENATHQQCRYIDEDGNSRAEFWKPIEQGPEPLLP